MLFRSKAMETWWMLSASLNVLCSGVVWFISRDIVHDSIKTPWSLLSEAELHDTHSLPEDLEGDR